MASIKKIPLKNGASYSVSYYDIESVRRRERYKTRREAKLRVAEIIQQSEIGVANPRYWTLTLTSTTGAFGICPQSTAEDPRPHPATLLPRRVVTACSTPFVNQAVRYSH